MSSPEEGEVLEHDENEVSLEQGPENPVQRDQGGSSNPSTLAPAKASGRPPVKASTNVLEGVLHPSLVDGPAQSPREVSQQFLREVVSKHRKAIAEYKLLFTRWKRQPLSAVDEYNIPTWTAQDGNDILRWEFNFDTVDKTVWLPLLQVMETELQEAAEESEAGKCNFANITLSPVDGLLDDSLAHNKELRRALVNVENPPPTPPSRTFVAATIDLSDFDDVDSAGRRRGGRGGDGRRSSGGGGEGGRTGQRGSDRSNSQRPDAGRRKSRGGYYY